MIDSLFYYPMTLHRGSISAPVLAPFVKNLPSVSGVVEEIYVRTQDANPAGSASANAYSAQAQGVSGGQGVYVWDATGNRFRNVMPYTTICEAVVNGATVDIYYSLTVAGPTIPFGATVYRNGVAYSGTTFTIGDNATWAVLTYPAITAGSVRTVNGQGPDANGNVPIATASATVAGLIKIGANLAIDGNGVLSADVPSPYTLPEATTTTLGGIFVGSGLSVSAGIVSANVTSVNGHGGAVVIAASDITTGTFGASVLGATPGDNEILITNAAGVPTWVSTLPTSNLPSSILGAVDYQGTFIPGTTTLPAAATANKGWYFVASAAGTYTPPGGSLLTFAAGDWLISNGSVWETVSNQGAVTSVNGQTGAVSIQAVDNNDATGSSLISDSGSSTGVVKFKTIVAGANVSIAPDANGNLKISSTTAAPGPATTTALGSVIVPTGSGLAVDASGNITNAGVTAFNTRTGAVTLTLTDITAVGGAPIASPAFTGTPTAPTPGVGTSTTDIATTAFVAESFAPIHSPALTGTPTAPTPPLADNSTNIATTAFVEAAIAASGGGGGGGSGVSVRYDFDATAGQTSFPVAFPAGAIVEVFRNGGILLATDYDTGGTGPVVVNAPCNAGDDVVIVVQDQYQAMNAMPITGGTFTGPAYGVTPTEGDSSTTLATTAFVQEAVAASSAGVTTFNTRNGAVTLEASDVSGVGGALVGSANTFTAANDFTGGSVVVPTQIAGTSNTTAASTAFVETAISTAGGSYAPLASPAFTGTPTAPTPTAGANNTDIATTAFVATSYAPLASPALTGVPVAPTATAGTNTTQIATTQFVETAVTGLAPLASPALTGTPTVPTAGAGTDSTQAASTAFVYGASQGSVSVALTNANVTLTAAQYSAPVIVFTGALTASVVVTVPTTGHWDFVNATTGAFTVTVSNGSGATQVVAQSITAFTPLVSNVTEGVVALAAVAGGVTTFNTRSGAVTLALSDVTGVGGAPLASPAFTGTPTAPTPTAGNSSTDIATTAFVAASFAPLASPALTGAPTAPTQAPGNSSTDIATTAFVATSFAPLASPALSGTPTAPTAAAGTSTTQVASTGFVYGATQGAAAVALAAANVTLTAAQYSVPVIVFTGTLTASVTVTVPTTGQWDFLNTTTGAFTVTVSNGSGATQIVTQSTTAFTPLVSNATEGVVALAASAAGVTTFNTRSGAVTLQAADVTAVGGALLASPAFTGTPTAPTQTAGNSSTDIATTAFVATSFAPLASPSLTGAPLAPTAAVGTNTTQLATTGFVYGASQGSSSVALTNANVTLTAAQYSVPIVVLTGTLTANVNVTFPTTGTWQIYNATTGAFTATATSGTGATLVIPQGVVSEIVSNSTAGILASQPTAISGRLQVAAESYTVTALGSVSGTQTLNMATSSEWTMTLTGPTTLAFTNTLGANTSQVFYLRFTNAGNTGNSIAWPSGTQFAGGVVPTFTSGGIDLVGVKYDTTSSTFFVFVIGLAIAV